MTFSGYKIVQSELITTLVPIFPDKPNTKRRRRRTVAKYGSTHREVPSAMIASGTLLIHPVALQELRASMTESGVQMTSAASATRYSDGLTHYMRPWHEPKYTTSYLSASDAVSYQLNNLSTMHNIGTYA